MDQLLHISMSHLFSIGFYNLENLFDPFDQKANLDKDFTPTGKFQWDEQKYSKKINQLSEVIAKIGLHGSEQPPILLGVCEVESESCLQDLVNSSALERFNYGYVFQKSEDPRGMQVALLFQKEFFKVLSYETYTIEFQTDVEPTRDVLQVTGELFGQNLHCLINHWPSRKDGTIKTNHKRISAADLVQKIIGQLSDNEEDPKIIIMGDFNDDPSNQSMLMLDSSQFVNSMVSFHKQKKGSVKYKGKWIMFDQILFSKNLQNHTCFSYQSSHIYVDPSLIQKSGRYKGSPKRTFTGNYYQGGFSDHFPVYIYLENHRCDQA